MGILPLQFINDVNRKNLKLIGSELISIMDLEKGINPSDDVTVEIKYASGEIKKIERHASSQGRLLTSGEDAQIARLRNVLVDLRNLKAGDRGAAQAHSLLRGHAQGSL